MNIRKMVKGDEACVLDMMIPFYNSDAVLCHPSESVLRKCVSDCVAGIPYLEGFVFEMDGVAAGYGMTAIGYATEAGGICIHIEDIYIKPGYRGKGIGTAFLNYVEDRYRDIAVRFRLEVEPDNESADRVYRRSGYWELGYRQLVKDL
jgi:GNAT superfamily N-acetyltransferase